MIFENKCGKRNEVRTKSGRGVAVCGKLIPPNKMYCDDCERDIAAKPLTQKKVKHPIKLPRA